MNKKVLFSLFISFITINIFAQDFFGKDYIKPVNEKGFYAVVKNERGDLIEYESNRMMFSIPKSEVVLIEYSERGLVFYNKQYIKSLDLSNYSSLLFAKGNNVYIPFSSDITAQRTGSMQLRKLLAEDNFGML